METIYGTKILSHELDNKLVTGIDKLLKLVEEMEEVSLTYTANYLKVPKNIVKHWCDTLEEEKLISTRTTLRETYIIPFGKKKSSYKHLFRQHISSLTKSIHNWEENLVITKEKELQKKIDELNEKLSELKKYEKIRLDVDKQINKLIHEKMEFNLVKKELKKELIKISDQNNVLDRKKSSLENKEKELTRKLNELVLMAKTLSDKEELVNFQKKNVYKRDKIIEGKRIDLVKREANLMNQLDELVSITKVLSEKDNVPVQQERLEKYSDNNISNLY